MKWLLKYAVVVGTIYVCTDIVMYGPFIRWVERLANELDTIEASATVVR